MKITIEINDTYTIESRRGASLLVNMADIETSMLPMLFENGLTQKIGDGKSQAAKLALVDHFGEDNVPDGPMSKEHKAWLETSEGSKVAAKHELELMTAAYKTLKDGSWSQRSAGVVRDDRTAAIVNVFSTMLPKDAKKRFAKLTFREKLEAANANEIDETLVSDEIARLAQMREDKAKREAAVAKLGKKVTITF